uniref:UPAR/Ly6 domain-containing protein n=1 Tax=Lates calcarifer TaxID=8187 RepID=A0A4W6BLF3_LATCA
NMKLVILSLLVVLVVSQSEALKCHCGGDRSCPGGSVENCAAGGDVCIRAILFNPPSHFRGCYRSRDCQVINNMGIGSASCCRTDMCNR